MPSTRAPVNGWDQMATAVTANNQQVGHLEVGVPKLRERSQRARSLYAQYAAMKAAKQEVWSRSESFAVTPNARKSV